MKAVSQFFKDLWQKILSLLPSNKQKRGYSRSYSRNSYRPASAPVRSAERTQTRRAASERKAAPAKKVAGIWNTVSDFFVKLWGKLMSLDRRVLACIAASVFIVIAVPVVIAIARPAPKKADAPISTVTSSVTDPADPEGVLPPEGEVLTVTTTPTPEPTPMRYAIPGEEGEHVSAIQERLMDLGYMDYDVPTSLYGPQTQAAFKMFASKNGIELPENGIDESSYNLLMSDEAKKYTASEGDEGEDVRELQKRLVELGYLDSATGYYGTDTVAAVKKFQERNGLTADGKIGEHTKEMLYSGDAKANSFKLGEKSDTIKTYQQRLKKLGYLMSEPDGSYGNDTFEAVKRFQSQNGLIADGWLGIETASLLMSDDAEPSSLKVGANGPQVEKLQKRLVELNYLRKATGYYGSDTEAAVRAFQKRNGLTVDGKAGSRTISVLMSDSAKKSANGPVSGSSSSGGSKPSGGSSSSGGSKPSGGGSSATVTGANVDSFISVAKSQLGVRYVRGGKKPSSGFDCSGFVYWCLNQVGVKQNYLTSSGWRSVTKYQKIGAMGNAQKGDILVFKGHVGIALGGGQMIDASSGEGCIRITKLSLDYWKRNYICGFRIF